MIRRQDSRSHLFRRKTLRDGVAAAIVGAHAVRLFINVLMN
jgi:hypothetical protein